MSLDGFLNPWQGDAFRHLPDVPGVQFFDFGYLGLGKNHRWNLQGQKALYFAGDVGVMHGEWARHLAVNRNGLPAAAVNPRKVFQVRINLERVIDLRDQQVWNAISLNDPPNCFLEIAKAQAASQYVMAMSLAQAVIVPSVVFIDDLDRWNLVVFAERVPNPQQSFVIVDDTRRIAVP